MTQQHHDHKHSHKKSSSGGGIHRDWRFWTVIVMLVAMGIYVVTLDDAVEVDGDGPPVPAIEGP